MFGALVRRLASAFGMLVAINVVVAVVSGANVARGAYPPVGHPLAIPFLESACITLVAGFGLAALSVLATVGSACRRHLHSGVGLLFALAIGVGYGVAIVFFLGWAWLWLVPPHYPIAVACAVAVLLLVVQAVREVGAWLPRSAPRVPRAP